MAQDDARPAREGQERRPTQPVRGRDGRAEEAAPVSGVKGGRVIRVTEVTATEYADLERRYQRLVKDYVTLGQLHIALMNDHMALQRERHTSSHEIDFGEGLGSGESPERGCCALHGTPSPGVEGRESVRFRPFT